MDLTTFLHSVERDASPPEGLSPGLQALWHAARGNWDEAHTLCQRVDDPDGAWIHAHLHREEGDTANALYGYQRAEKPPASDTLAEERNRLIQHALGSSS